MRDEMPESTTLVLFGATGDLARTKLWPALHDLAATGRLPDGCRVVGISRSATTEDLKAAATKSGKAGRLGDTARWDALLASIEVVNGEANDPGLYQRLATALDHQRGPRLTYLSVAPSLFSEISG